MIPSTNSLACRLLKIVLFNSCVVLSGCISVFFPTAERFVRVSGTVAEPAARDCRLRLVRQGWRGGPAHFQPIQREFGTSFVVAPGSNDFVAEIECADHVFRSQKYPINSRMHAIELGQVMTVTRPK